MDHPSQYSRFHKDWNSGKRGRRNQGHHSVNTELVRRVVVGDGPGSSFYPNAQNSTGEMWVRVNIANGATIPVDYLKESISTAVGTTVRIYNHSVRGENCLFFFRMRSKKVSL